MSGPCSSGLPHIQEYIGSRNRIPEVGKDLKGVGERNGYDRDVLNEISKNLKKLFKVDRSWGIAMELTSGLHIYAHTCTLGPT